MAKKSKRKIQLLFYKSIEDLPINRWFKIDETSDLRYLLFTPRKLRPHEKRILALTWENLMSEFIDEFGISDKLESVLNCRKKIILYEIKEALGSGNQQTFIGIEKRKLEQLTRSEIKESNFSAMASVATFIGFRIDPNVVSVKEYFAYVHKLNEAARQNIKQEFEH